MSASKPLLVTSGTFSGMQLSAPTAVSVQFCSWKSLIFVWKAARSTSSRRFRKDSLVPTSKLVGSSGLTSLPL
jgi:hypothetical protein